ncbi:MAG: HEAT repeat domain-containing protein, partial [Planctomycetia bacterium]|nr:HEAT repeat domain-containing protein [Planctomycetia bacterium]
DNHRFSVHTRHLDLMYERRANWTSWYDGPTLAEKYAVWLKERGCDAVFIDIWKYIQRVKGGDHELYTSCSVDVLEVTEDFGGEKGLKEFCDIMRRHGIKVLLWVNFQYITAGGMSQVDGGRGSSLLREHPEWRLLDRQGNTRGRGLTVMSFASGWKEYLVSRLKHLKDACGVAGYYVDNSAGAVRRIDYGVEPPSGMMAHYWDIVHQLQAHGLIMMFEETGGVTINGGAGYMWQRSMTMDGTEWGLTKGAPTGVHAQTDRQRGLLHQNASGLHTLRRLTGGDAQQAKHMRTLLDKHGGLPDRIRLVNLRRKDGGRGWAYDNTEWVYADKTVPYKIIHTYKASKFEVKLGKVTAGKPEMLFQPDKGHLGIRAAKENDGREIVWLAEVNVKDSPDLVDLLKVQFDARYSSSCRQTVELYNYTAGKWEEVDSRTVKRNGPGFRWSRYDTGGHYVSGKGKIRLRVHATSSRPFVCRLENLRVTIDQGTGLRHRILARRNKTKTSPPLTIAVGGKARALKSPPLPFKPTTRPRLARPPARKLKSTKALIAKLRAPAMQDRASAAHELGLKGDVKAAGALIEAMKDKEWRVRDRAAEALYKLQDPSAVPVLVDAIRDPAWRVRFWAIKGLGKLKADIAVLRLIGALEDEHQGVIEHAARALAQIKHPAGFVALTEALKSKRVDVRHSAVGAFGLWGGDEAAGVLSEALSDEERGVRLRVVDSLARIGTPACADALVAALEDESDRVRRRAIPAIAAIGDKRAIPILEALLVGGYHQTRAAARAGLKRLGSDPVPYVLKAAENPKAKGGGEAVEARYAAYVKLKAHIATALGETGDKRAVPKLQELLKDKDREVKRAAQRALKKIKSK